MVAQTRDNGRLPLVSLIICSRNRAQALERCLRALERSDVKEVSSEVVIVDNASTDTTADVIRSFSQNAGFPVRTAFEPRVGLSYARNAGVGTARGEILAFTDDDCYVSQRYFAACVQAFSSQEIDYCGGRILPFSEEDSRYGYNEDNVFKLIPAGSFIRAGQIQGANMAFRRSLIDRIGVFDPMLGAGTPFRCEDVEYVSRASLAGFVGAHVPQLSVYHHHGRKLGDIGELKRLNDFARGAYYAKRIGEGRLGHVSFWAKETWQKRKHRSFPQELRGALAYLKARIIHSNDRSRSWP